MIRLLAALVAPVVVVLALLTWVPDDVSGSGLLSIANTGDEPAARPAQSPGVGQPDDLASLRRSLAGRGTVTYRSKEQRVVIAAEDPPFRVTIDTMTPSVVPSRGPVVLRGRVTNTTDETWTELNVHPFLSPSAMRTSAEVELAAASDPEIFIDSRIVTPGAFDETIDELAPGETARWLIRLPQAVLQDEIDESAGVYWIGVHVLGANSEGRDGLADGRARSFIPLVGAGAPVVPTSMVVPIRRSTLHDADGRVAGEDEWAGELAPGGRLSNLLSFVERAGAGQLTVLLDPAVLDAVRQLADGNPERDLSPTPTADEEEEEEPPVEEDEVVEPGPAQEPGAAWLDRFVRAASEHRVLALPYGDLDMAGAARNNPGLDARASKLSEDLLDELGIPATPAIAPPSGLLTGEALSLFDEDETVLLSSESLPPRYADAASPPTEVISNDRRISVYDPAIVFGGPGPNPRLDPVSLRQRVLAEAAVRAISNDDRPLVVNLPSDFDPGAQDRGFYLGLARSFVRLGTTLDDATGEAPEVGELVYPERQLVRELGPGNFAATADLIDSGETLDRLLSANATVGPQVVREALATTSYMLRDDPVSASASAYAAAAWIDTRLNRVRLSAPSFVILSADSGPFAVTVTNGLEEPIRLRILARTPDNLVIKAPQSIELQAGKQQSVTLTAQADSIGVHPLRLIATDESGRPLGATEEVSVRSNKVGRIIWVIMGAGVGILFLAIAVRLVRRVRGARAS